MQLDLKNIKNEKVNISFTFSEEEFYNFDNKLNSLK